MIYSMGAVSMGIAALATGQLASGIARVVAEPRSLVYLFLFAVLGALGIQFVYLVMKVFGSLVTVMTTSLRKAITVMLSFVVFKDKKFTTWHAWAILLLSTGTGLNIYEKTAKKNDAAHDDEEMLDSLNPVEIETKLVK
jgi:adenosine 3'-phospho 5'-phosphosulfate transporter B3